MTKYLTQINLAMNDTMTNYALSLLDTVPGKQVNGQDRPDARAYQYALDKTALPWILANGAFQERRDISILPKNLFSSFTAPLVNFLWKLPEQQGFIFKATKDQYNGQDVCDDQGNPTLSMLGGSIMKNNVWCDKPHGTVHVVGQWKFQGSQKSKLTEGWYKKVGTVAGVEKLGDDVNGSLDLKTAILSSINTQGASGGVGKDLSAQQVADQIKAADFSQGPPMEKVQSWSLPVCDLTGITGDKTCDGSVFRGPQVSFAFCRTVIALCVGDEAK